MAIVTILIGVLVQALAYPKAVERKNASGQQAAVYWGLGFLLVGIVMMAIVAWQLTNHMVV